MARTANMSVSVTWGGQAAAKGLQSFTQSLNTMAGVADHARKSLAGMMPSNLFSAAGIKGLADAKAGIEMIRGVFQTFVGVPLQLANNIIKLGAEMEGAGIRMGALMDDMDAGKKTISALSKAAMATGVPFADMAKGMKSLMAGGLSAEGAVDVIERTRNAAMLMGTGAEGFNAVIGAVTQLQASAAATEGPLKALEASGIPVMTELAKKLSAVTGEVIDVNKAMKMVQEGTVLTATALDAVFAASSSERVAAAAAELENTVEHQLAKAQIGFQEVLRNIGAELIKTFDPAQVLAGFSGAMQGILDIVKMIADTFLPVVDPKDKGKALQDTFKFGRDMAFIIAEELVKGAIQLKDYVSDAASLLKVVLAEIKIAMLEQTKFWTTGFMGGRSTLARTMISEEEHAALPGQIAAARAEADKLMAQGFAAGTNLRPIEEKFNQLRMAAAAKDAAGLNQVQQAMNELGDAARKAIPNLNQNAEQFKNAAGNFAGAGNVAIPNLNQNAEQFKNAAGNFAGAGNVAIPNLNQNAEQFKNAAGNFAGAGKNLKPALDANAKAMEEQAKKAKDAAAKIELMNQNVRDRADKMFSEMATPMEKFAQRMQNALAEMAQVQGPEKGRFQAAMRRRVGADLEAFLKEFGPKAAEPAQAQLAGSAAAIESDIRARMEAEAGQQDLPVLMKQAMENAKEQNAQQIKKLDELVNAAHAAGMFRTIMALPKP